MPDCSQCEGTGYRPIEVDGVRYMRICDCRRSRVPSPESRAAKLDNAGFTSLATILGQNPKLKDLLRDPDQRVADFLATRRGKAMAVTSREIAGHLWPGTTMDAAHAERCRRDVTASIERLRRRARVPICASKESPAGYFMPATAEELREMHDRAFSEGVKLIVLSQLYSKDADLVRLLEGQMKFTTENTESAENSAASVNSVVEKSEG